jgi:cytokinin riboside 5'-monophosphate phosphoribohydrolase
MRICVFSSSSNAIPEIYFEEGRNLGRLIGQQGHSLINGGANVGLMETVTVGAASAGAMTTGIIPEQFISRSLASDKLHELIITPDMQERKARMREMADAFIALPGGFGTIEEIMEVLTLRQLNYHSKPIVFINTANFFDFLFRQFELFFEQQFTKELYKELYFVADDSEQALAYINTYEPVVLDSKWFVVPVK